MNKKMNEDDFTLPALCGSRRNQPIWAFWSHNISWYNNYPDFTLCFEETIFPLILLLLLFFLSLTHLPFLLKRPIVNRKFGIFNSTKLTLTGIICFVYSIELVLIVTEEEDNLSPRVAEFLRPILMLLTLLIVAFYIWFEYFKGVHSSSTLFVFWSIYAIETILICRTEWKLVSSQDPERRDIQSVFSIIILILTFLNFILHCFADKRAFGASYKESLGNDFESESSPLLAGSLSWGKALQQNEANYLQPSPETSASILSQMTFHWVTPLIWKGLRQTLSFNDLYDITPAYRSEKIEDIVNPIWIKEREKYPKTLEEEISDQSLFVDKKSKKKNYPSFYRALRNAFGFNFLIAGIYRLLADISGFAQPQILSLLVVHLTSGDANEWHGYFYVIALFSVAMLRTFLNQRFTLITQLLGIRLRSATVSIVYRKALQLSPSARRGTSVGQIVNLMSVDSQRLQEAPPLLHQVWSTPLNVILATFFLWQELGPSVLAGLATILCLIPINSYFMAKQRILAVGGMRFKDQRMKIMNEIFSGIKVLKLFAWEPSYVRKVLKIRHDELVLLKKNVIYFAITSILFTCTPFLVAISSFSVFTLVSSENILTTQRVFVSLSLFNLLNPPLILFSRVIASLVHVRVALDRLNKYLTGDELDPHVVVTDPNEYNAVLIENGSFTWSKDVAPVLENINLSVNPGSLVAIVGAVGCGKSSLLSAALGEMMLVNGRVHIKPRRAYVPQVAWCQNMTLQDNVLFGEKMEPRRYGEIIHACDLIQDLNMLPAGDLTEIGEKGINLSGGQKQRVSLARAVYQDADIYFLDDPLSAVDSHVGKQLFDKVIGPYGLLKDKTRLLVTHSLTYLPQMDKIIVMKDGQISEVGSYDSLMSNNGAFAEFVRIYADQNENTQENDSKENVTEETDKSADISSEKEKSGIVRKRTRSRSRSGSRSSSRSRSSPRNAKLMTEEFMESGGVKVAHFLVYVRSATLLVVILVLTFFILNISSSLGSNFWLSYWSEQNELANNSTLNLNTGFFLGIYSLLGFSQLLFVFLENLAYAYGTFNAARYLHTQLLNTIVKCPMAFFETTPIGRIMNRFSRDIDVIDRAIPLAFRLWLRSFGFVFTSIIAISIASPYFLIILLPLSVMYYLVQQCNIQSSRQLRRLDSSKRSPVISHFQDTLVGASSVRAYGKQQQFINNCYRLNDDNQVTLYLSNAGNLWLGLRLETIGNLVILAAGVFAILSRTGMGVLGAGLASLSVTYSLQITGSLNLLVRMACELENYAVSIERIDEYTKLPSEALWDGPISPPTNWPKHGAISFKNFSVRYRPGLPLILTNLSFSITGGEKVGIVGRTGAGKTSITLSLFRILEAASGSIMIDGVDISTLGLHDLRKRITIIPQDPVIFSGTLRSNLDPFDEYSDAEIWSALDQAHLRQFVVSQVDGLAYKLAEGGENLSVGQRQLLCLGRALLRKTKILVLDEATAAVDMETDRLIQETIRQEFNYCTVVTIAHRINTILDYDRVLVLEDGCIREFDKPNILLQNEKSQFYSLVKSSGLTNNGSNGQSS